METSCAETDTTFAESVDTFVPSAEMARLATAATLVAAADAAAA
jgi:hypothetical protein